MIEPGTGNLLDAKVEALVNTVNTEGVMGKGLALQFKKAFPENTKAYEKACRANEVKIGKMFIVDRGLQQPRWIINFPTKKHWRQPSRLSYIEDGLIDLILETKALGIRSIAVPPLGCGNGGLEWADVGPRIIRAFGVLPHVRVVMFAPDDGPAMRALIDRTARPAMTPGRAVFLAALAEYQFPGYEYRLSLLEAQKVAYFLHEAGDLERLHFKAHHYGPYADTLRNVLERLDGHYTSGYGDGRVNPETPIMLLPGAAEEARRFLCEQPKTLARLERVKRLIEGFETPFGMELLATVHWVATHPPHARNVDEAVTAVHNWSSRKKATMKRGHIEAAWKRLAAEGWLNGPSIPAESQRSSAG